MLHTKFHENRSTGSGEEDFLKVYNHIWAWRSSGSCEPDAANKLSFPLPKFIGSTHNLALICLAVSEKTCEMVDDRRRTTTDHG